MNHVADASHVRLRAALLWLAVTAAALAVGRFALPGVHALLSTPGPDFATLLVQLCSLTATVALVALWLLTTDVVRQVVVPTAGPTGAGRARPGALRTLLLTACGVAVLTTVGTAHAYDAPAPLTVGALDGLPLPDRATGTGPTPARAAVPHAAVVRVQPGDSLWAIATDALGPGASAADVASYWRRIHAANAAVIGPDPDLLQPDQQLRLPPR